MSTILQDKPQAGEVVGSNSRGQSQSERPIGVQHLTKRNQTTQDYEVVFVIDQSNTNQKAFDFALETAKNFGSRLVLVYLSPQKPVPEGYVEYARAEGIRDYAWQYYNDEANSKLDTLSKKAEEAGIEWSVRIHIGNAKNITRFSLRDSRAIIVLNKPVGGSWFRRSILRFSSNPDIGVPVFVH